MFHSSSGSISLTVFLFVLFALFIGTDGSTGDPRKLSQLTCKGRSMQGLALDMVEISGSRNSSMPWQKTISIIESSNKFISFLGGIQIFSAIVATFDQFIGGYEPPKINSFF